MKQLICFLALSIGIVSFMNEPAEAQIFKRRYARYNEKPPKMILVQIFTYQRRIEHYTRLNKPDKVKQIHTDAENMTQKIIMDFSDNFSFCPVYYYMDTNAHLVIEKKYNGVLLDKNLNPVNVSPDKTTQIVLFGAPISFVADVKSSNNKDPFDSDYVVGEGKQRLVVYDINFKKLARPLPNGSNNTYGGKPAKDADEYVYRSPDFDIYYKPYAKHLSEKMSIFYGSR